MLRTFNFKKVNDSVDAVVEQALELARQVYENKISDTYKEDNINVLKGMGKFMTEGTRFEKAYEDKGLALFSNPQVYRSGAVRENFNLVISQIVSAIVPEVVNADFARYIAEVHQVGFGDTARFLIESNDLFRVNMKAEGVRKGVDQPIFDNELTVNAHPYSVDTSVDFYHIASGVFNIGSFGVRIAKSFQAFIFINAVKGMTEAATKFGTSYSANGVTPELFGDLRDKVSAANGGAQVVAIGTRVALSNLSLEGNFQVQIGEEMNKVGYLDQYLGVPLIGLDNVIVPGTTNSTNVKLALSNDIIYLVPMMGDRPVKIVFEGDQISVEFDPAHTADSRYGISVEMRIGVAAICGSKYGIINL